MEILSGIGGGVLALFHYLFSVAVVVFVADLSGSGSSADFFEESQKSGENPINLTKPKRPRIGFKAC